MKKNIVMILIVFVCLNIVGCNKNYSSKIGGGGGSSQGAGNIGIGSGSTNVLDTMSDTQRRQVNRFLSNFSETLYGAYPSEEITDKISFAFHHNQINNSKFKVIYDKKNSLMGISAKLVNQTVKKYFGTTVPLETTVNERWIYKNGNFMTKAADGESYAYFSIAKNMTDLKDGTFEIAFNVYAGNDPHGEIPWICYSYTVMEADSNNQFCYSGSAKVKEKTYNGSKTYELISYHIK